MTEPVKSELSIVYNASAQQRTRLLACAILVNVVACGGGTARTAEDAAMQAPAASSTAATSGGANASNKPTDSQATSAASAAAKSGSAGNAGAAVAGNAAHVPANASTTPTMPSAGSTGTATRAAGASAGSVAAAGGGGNAAQGSAAAGTGASAAGSAGPTTSMTPMTLWQWPTGKPEDFGVEAAWLDDAADSIQRSTGNRYGMVVVRKGTLIYEKYWEGGADDKHIVYSCTKSWGSSLIGIAVTQGLLTVKDEVRKWVPMPAPGVSEGALLEHVLTQSAHTTPPGQSFQYNSGYLLNTAPEVLGAAISSMGMTPHDFFVKNLAEPLGLQMTWPECPKGGCSGTRYKEGFIQFGNEPPEAPNADLPLSSVRDQAKLGWLWANHGKWDDKQLIDPAYIQAGSTPGAGFRSMYGYLMWIQNAEQFGAIGGVGNCYVNIMPSKQLVIAVMGNDTGLGQGGGWSAFQSLASRIPD